MKCKTSPEDLLAASSKTLNTQYGVDSSKPLDKAIMNNDLEAFLKIYELYHLFPEPIPTKGAEELMVGQDCPEILDEYIRRTGVGIEVAVSTADDENTDQPDAASGSANERKMYLGLSVHGKKRKDLAQKNDPDAQKDDGPALPLLWKAFRAGSLKMIDYLSGDGPAAAYKFYASSNEGDRAEKIRAMLPNFTSALPRLLGWTSSNLNESPLTAALLSGEIDVMQKLFEKSPKLAGGWLHDR